MLQLISSSKLFLKIPRLFYQENLSITCRRGFSQLSIIYHNFWTCGVFWLSLNQSKGLRFYFPSTLFSKFINN